MNKVTLQIMGENKHTPGRSNPPASVPGCPIYVPAPLCRPQSWLLPQGSAITLSHPVLHRRAGRESSSSFPCLPLKSTGLNDNNQRLH